MECDMGNTTDLLHRVLSAAALTTLITACSDGQQAPGGTGSAAPTAVAIDDDDIGGLVTSGAGPEAGVWVIAETDAFETRFVRIVVTDEQGRYVVPDLPAATYQVWVRGYGLADSARVEAVPGQIVNLTATVAPDAATAAKVYPAAAWYAMVHVPSESELANVRGGLNRYLGQMKNLACVGCHQLGNLATRTIPEAFAEYGTGEEAWIRRMQSGQAGAQMINTAGQLGGLPFKYLGDWTTRIAAGELPSWKPERPKGIERNVVATVRDWASEKTYLHDLTGTDRRDPTVNGYGKLYGSPELSTDDFPILDPVANTDTSFRAAVLDPNTESTHDTPVTQPSAYWGDERIWNSQANTHNPMMDQRGRVWYTARVRRDDDNPAFCKAGSNHPSAKYFPSEKSGRQLAVYDPATGKYTPIDTCFSTHHLQFAEDANNTLWLSNDRAGEQSEVVGWFNTKLYDETGDAAAAQGWTPLILDTNGNGKPDAYVGPNDPVDPTKDKRIIADLYAIMPNPADGSIWGSSRAFPGSVVRLDLGDNPPMTTLAEIYTVPLPGFGIRGADIDRNGVVWVSLGSGHLGEFDRRKCRAPLNGPNATGNHCPEGWSFHRYPGPGFPELPEQSVESSYYTWVDQRNASGLGANTPISTGNLFDGVHALVANEFVTLRIPYPLGFFSKGFEGRIDDPNAGWKGRGLWVPEGDRTPWHTETGKGSRPMVVHFQVRPDPLAK
jgi:hypothetical protein